MLIVLVGMLYITARLVLLGGFSLLEQQETDERVQIVLNILSDEFNTLVTMVGDWSYWDDTYQFVQGNAPNYVDDNLGDSVFDNLHLNLMVFINDAGQMVYAKAYDLQTHEAVPLPDGLSAYLSPDSALLSSNSENTAITGILNLPDGPLVFASEPILTSLRKGPTAGRLLLGYYLNAPVTQQISRMAAAPLAIYPVNGADLPEDVQAARAQFSAEDATYTQPLSNELFAGYALLRDINDQPAFIIRAEVERDILEQGQKSISYLLVALVVVGLLCSIVIMWLLQRTVLVRLAHLGESLAAVRRQRTPSLRVPVEGHDEISLLAMTMNETLEALEQSRTALFAKQEILHSIITGAPLILFSVSLDGQITLLEGKGLQRLGIKPDEIIGQSIFETDSPFGALAQHIQLDSQDTAETVLHLGSATFDVRYTPLRNRDGAIQGIVGVATDITERKRAEQQQLESERARMELEKDRELLQVKERFISTTSHEFRTPIAVILATKETLQHYYDRLTPERRAENWEKIEGQSRRMLNMLDDLLTFSKSHSGKSTFVPVSMNFPALCQKFFEEVRIADNGQHTFIFKSSKSSFYVDTDEYLIQHIVVNLLSNAMKYSPLGAEVRMDVQCGEDGVFIRVSDQGIGIPEADLPHLFEPFYRAGNTKGYKGTGLGLAIVKDSVETHGGEIRCESAAGKGTSFIVRLPATGC